MSARGDVRRRVCRFRFHFPFPAFPLALFLSTVAGVALSNPGLCEAQSTSSVVRFLGQRFAVCRGPQAFESAAFDPGTHRFASHDAIRDRCGNMVSAGPDEQPGLAWDPSTQTYWQVTSDRVVRRWNGDALLDTVFTIPPTFSMPGSGPDTLESVRGIAVDDSYVYLVDAGPAAGQIESNEWLKFTRAGVPVKSSRSTNLAANLDADPDALFDDIVYVPPTSPVAPGLLLIALEHSGIQVVDTEGNSVGGFRWSAQSLPPGLKLAAFAGITIDPDTGCLYLVDNDQGFAQVWVPLQGSGPSEYIVGTGDSQAYLYRPNSGCNLPLWKDLSPGFGTDPTGMFGIAYRTVDSRVYGYDFSSGDLWSFPPLSGEATLVSTIGPTSIWGLAYDTERDVLYGGEETTSDGILVHVTDPTDGSQTPLPSATGFYFDDLAFDPSSKALYAVDSDHSLLRIDRDTGLATVVGDTGLFIRGLTWDPLLATLIGVVNFPVPTLYTIDPVTGAPAQLATLSTASGWEGLAMVTVAADPVAAAPLVLGPRGPLGLSAYPNPTTGVTTLRFRLPGAASVEVGIYDLRGRRIRELWLASLGAGTQSLQWDGRDAAGRAVADGVYLVRVQDRDGAAVTKLLQLR